MSQPRRRAGRRDDLAVVDVQRVRLDLHARVAARQPLGIAPVRGGALAVQHPGRGQHEHARADGAQARAAPVRRADQRQQGLRRFLVGVAPAGDDDGVGLAQQPRRIARLDGNAAGGADRSPLDGGNQKVVPVHVQFRTVQGKQLDGTAEFKRAQAVVGQGDNTVTGVHGAILTHVVVRASAGITAPARQWLLTQQEEPCRS